MIEFSANLLYQQKLAKRNQSLKENEIKHFRGTVNLKRHNIKSHRTEFEAKDLNQCQKNENSGNFSTEKIDYWAFAISIGLFIIFNLSYFGEIVVV